MKRNKLLKVAGIVLLTLTVTAVMALELLLYLAKQRGAAEVAIPVPSQTAELAEGSDYQDAYRIPMADDLQLSDVLNQQSMIGGKVIYQGNNEIIYRGSAPGLFYYASYHISKSSEGSYLTLSTLVFYESNLGRLYFSLVGIFHRRVVPYVLSAMTAS